MKRFLYSTAIAVVCALMLSACDLETSDNGDLDGMWHLKAVDTLATGGHTDMRNEGISWCVQGCLLQFWQQGDCCFCRFSHSGNTLSLDTLRLWSKELGDPAIEDLSEVQRYGVNGFFEKYNVEKLSADDMVLRSPVLRLTFKKY